MRCLLMSFGLLVSGCSIQASQDLATAKNLVSDNRANILVSSDIKRTWDNIEPSVLAVCRDAKISKASSGCTFRLEISNAHTTKPNARTWRGTDGVVHISVNSAMLRIFRNTDEIAFVLAHEAAHTVADHHGKVGHKNLSGGFTISHGNSQYMELEADVIGAVIATNAGFDPVKGARLLERLNVFEGKKSKTHPELGRRLETIARTSSTLRQGNSVVID